jgi:hypothetical protein
LQKSTRCTKVTSLYNCADLQFFPHSNLTSTSISLGALLRAPSQSLPGFKSTYKMQQGSTRRVKPTISYAELEASKNRSPLNTPTSRRMVTVDESDDAEDEEDEIQCITSRSRVGLRERKRNQSLKFLENGDTATIRLRPKKRSVIEEVRFSWLYLLSSFQIYKLYSQNSLFRLIISWQSS